MAFYWTVPLTWVNAMSGMETSLFVMLCSLAMFLLLLERFVQAFVVLFLAVLTRPEGLVLSAISVASISLHLHERRKMSVAFLLAFVLPCLAYLVWKYYYFGSLLPNAFYLKVIGNSNSTFPGLQYVRFFVTSMILLTALSFGIRIWKNAVLLTVLLWTAFLIAFFIFVLPIEGLYDRFLWPAFAGLCITAAIGLCDLVSRFELRFFGWFAFAAIGANVSIMMFSPRTEQAFAAHEDVWDANMDHVVRELTILPHHDSLRVAYGDAGYVAYRSGISHIDLFGLNDTRIAHARTFAECSAIVRSEHLDILLLPIRIGKDSGAEFVEDAYGLVKSSKFESCASIEAFPYTLVFLLNRDSPWYLDCKNAILHRLHDSSSYLLAAPAIDR